MLTPPYMSLLSIHKPLYLWSSESASWNLKLRRHCKRLKLLNPLDRTLILLFHLINVIAFS